MIRPGHVFHRKPSGLLPIAQSADGVNIVDSFGRRYLDASGGAVVVNLGHARAEIARAVTEQLSQGYYFHPTMFTTQVVEDLASSLAAHAPEGISRFYFMTTGSEAVETAIKLARQIQLARGEESRHRLISRWRSYHGLSLGALAATGRTSFRTPFAPMFRDAFHIPPPYCLRCSYGLKPDSCGLQCAKALEETILNLGPETVSAFMGETVSGATLAVYPPPQGYWTKIREICNRYGVMLILDEVMSGMGRTGKWFASEHYGVSPDLVTLGKGLSGGSLPLSAVGVREEHYSQVVETGGFVHGGTFSHHPACAAAGLAAVQILEKESLVERAREKGEILGAKLDHALSDHPHVGDIRGLGMMWGVELVKEKQTLEPFDRSALVLEMVWEKLFSDGVILYKSLGLAGKNGEGLVVAPPFVINEPEMDMVVSGLKGALNHVLGV
jgi:hypothetical protein